MKPFHEVLRELDTLERADAPPFELAPSDVDPEPVTVYLESTDVAAVLGTTAAAIKSFAARGLLRSSARTVRGVQLYSAVDVAAFLERRKRAAEAGAVSR